MLSASDKAQEGELTVEGFDPHQYLFTYDTPSLEAQDPGVEKVCQQGQELPAVGLSYLALIEMPATSDG